MYEVYICKYLSLPPEWLITLLIVTITIAPEYMPPKSASPWNYVQKVESLGAACSFDPDSLIKTILLLLFPQRFAIL